MAAVGRTLEPEVRSLSLDRSICRQPFAGAHVVVLAKLSKLPELVFGPRQAPRGSCPAPWFGIRHRDRRFSGVDTSADQAHPRRRLTPSLGPVERYWFAHDVDISIQS